MIGYNISYISLIEHNIIEYNIAEYTTVKSTATFLKHRNACNKMRSLSRDNSQYVVLLLAVVHFNAAVVSCRPTAWGENRTTSAQMRDIIWICRLQAYTLVSESRTSKQNDWEGYQHMSIWHAPLYDAVGNSQLTMRWKPY